MIQPMVNDRKIRIFSFQHCNCILQIRIAGEIVNESRPNREFGLLTSTITKNDSPVSEEKFVSPETIVCFIFFLFCNIQITNKNETAD